MNKTILELGAGTGGIITAKKLRSVSRFGLSVETS